MTEPVKKKRGRKPKPKPENEVPKVKKKRGRKPKKKRNRICKIDWATWIKKFPNSQVNRNWPHSVRSAGKRSRLKNWAVLP